MVNMLTALTRDRNLPAIKEEVDRVPAQAREGLLFQETVRHAVQEATLLGYREIVQFFLDEVMSPEAGMGGIPSELTFLNAVRKGHVEVVKLLTEHVPIDPQAIKIACIEARTVAESTGDVTLLELLEQYQDVNTLDDHGEARIHRAVMQGDLIKLEQLIACKANVELPSRYGQTPLLLAAKYCQDPENRILAALLEAGADPKRFDHVGHSPFARAIEYGNVYMAQLLLKSTLERLQEIAATEVEPSTPWYVDLALDALGSKQWRPLLDLLLSAGAKLDGCAARGCPLCWVMDSFPKMTEIESQMEKLRGSLRQYEDQIPSASLMKADVAHLIEDARQQFENAFEKLDYLLDHGVDPALRDAEGRLIVREFVTNGGVGFIDGALERLTSRFLLAGLDLKI